MKKHKFITVGVIIILTLSLSSCGQKQKKVIGISMPTHSSERWILDAKYTVLEFEEEGYETKIAFAEDVVGNQASQISNFLDEGVDLLMIAAIDSDSLTEVLKEAHEKGIPIISYDRLIMGTDTIDYYVSFDNYQVGILQGEYIVDHLDFSDREPKYIELFAGSLDDNNSFYFFDGAMSVLKPYIESGQLVVKSNQFDIKEVHTLRWDKMLAKSRMTSLLNTYYTDVKIDAVLSPYDGISRGVIEALLENGYQSGDLPIITGQDAETTSIQAIIHGNQSMTVFKDTRLLAKKAVEMAVALMNDEPVETNDDSSYYNGEKVVPSYLLEPSMVTADNWEEILVDNGYYTKEEFTD